jgi:dTMP kinase
MVPGKFIVLEGIDGSGTTTQTAELCSTLYASAGIAANTTFEPSSGPLGDAIRQILRNGKHPSMEDENFRRMLMMAFAADRLEHRGFIDYQLSLGNWVICDRYYPSSLVYQAGWDENLQMQVFNANYGMLKPDFEILLSVSATEAMRRIRSRGEGETIFENESMLEAHGRLYRHHFLRDNHAIIDGEGSVNAVTGRIMEKLTPLIHHFHEERGRGRNI